VSPVIKKLLVLLPLLGVIVSIDFVSQITLGEVIAISLTAVGGIVIFGKWLWDKASPNRFYNLDFCNVDIAYKKITEKEQFTKQASVMVRRVADVGVIFPRILARQKVLIDDISIRFVRRAWFPRKPNPCPLWDWHTASPSEGGFISDIRDLEWENQKNINPNKILSPRPEFITDSYHVAHLKYSPSTSIPENTQLPLGVDVHIYKKWCGFIELKLPTPNNKYAYKRGRITLLPISQYP